jgi:hypothetical protein
MAITLRTVNKALKAAGAKEELVKGSGYFYFSSGDAMQWNECSVYVNALNAMTVEQWVTEWRDLHTKYQKGL